MIGNFITDFINGSQVGDYKGQILKGIELHRIIDSFTDNHIVSKELRKILRKRHKKYASVAVDLVWDFYLCKNWSHFSQLSLNAFAKEKYEIMIKFHDVLPLNLKNKISLMINDDFLLAYNGTRRAERSLKWMDNRARFPSNFINLIHDLKENEELFDQMFMQFFPDLISEVDDHCSCYPSK